MLQLLSMLFVFFSDSFFRIDTVSGLCPLLARYSFLLRTVIPPRKHHPRFIPEYLKATFLLFFCCFFCLNMII